MNCDEVNVDYYEVLGVPRNATDKQIGSAYKSMMLKHHPDRNPDDPTAATKYKLVGDAYACLIDPNKRKQYDLGGLKAVNEAEAVDVKGLNGIGRVFGAVISRFGVPIMTQISNEFLEQAQTLCRSGCLDGDISTLSLEGKLFDLQWGIPVEGKVDRQNGVYYRFLVNERHVDGGFAISIKSSNKDKFKAVLFDNDGTVVYQEDAVKTRDTRSTQIRFFFTKFDTYGYSPTDQLNQASMSTTASANSSNNANEIKDPPITAVFSKLDGLCHSKKEILPGRYMLGIYGDNFIGKSSYSCLLVAANNESMAVGEIVKSDAALVDQRTQLSNLKAEYIQAKAVYEAALQRLESVNTTIDELLDQRDCAYKLFLKQSVDASNNISHTGMSIDEDGHRRKASISDNIEKKLMPAAIAVTAKESMDTLGSAVTAASSAGSKAMSVTAAKASLVGASVGNSASAAGGWLAKHISSGMSSLKTVVNPSGSQPAGSNPEAIAVDPAGAHAAPIANDDESQETIV